MWIIHSVQPNSVLLNFRWRCCYRVQMGWRFCNWSLSYGSSTITQRQRNCRVVDKGRFTCAFYSIAVTGLLTLKMHFTARLQISILCKVVQWNLFVFCIGCSGFRCCKRCKNGAELFLRGKVRPWQSTTSIFISCLEIAEAYVRHNLSVVICNLTVL